MITGISTASLFLRKHTEDAAEIIKNSGAETCEVFYSSFYEYRPEFSKALAPRICGFDVNSVHTFSTNFEPLLFNPSRRARGDGFYWLDQVMRSAQLLNCKNYTFHGFCRNGAGDNFDETGARMREVTEFCSRYGVTVCLENVDWCIYNRPNVFRELKSRCPDLRGVFDIKHARKSGYPWAMYIEDMRGAISYAHLSDIDENGRVCLPGKGVYNFDEILLRLADAGFNGALIIEVYNDSYGDLAGLSQSLAFLNETIYKLNLK